MTRYERRLYSRIPVKIDGNIIYSGNEIDIEVCNVSETGIGFYLRNPQETDRDDLLCIGDEINIQFVDSYNFGKEEFVSVQSLVGVIVQMREDNGQTYIGCKVCKDNNFADSNYESYVEQRKSSRFITIARNMSY